jgi:hypothetical protein
MGAWVYGRLQADVTIFRHYVLDRNEQIYACSDSALESCLGADSYVNSDIVIP